MTWKNGGGTTTEIATEPENAKGHDYLWRVSIADVARDGPFSRFPGFDRVSMMISGNGLVLDAGANGTVSLETLFQPAAYSGDWMVDGRLTDGPIGNFNVIYNPSKVSVIVDVVDLTRSTPHETRRSYSSTTTLLQGDPITVDDGRQTYELGIGDTLISKGYPDHLEFRGPAAPAQMCRAVVVEFRDPSPL